MSDDREQEQEHLGLWREVLRNTLCERFVRLVAARTTDPIDAGSYARLADAMHSLRQTVVRSEAMYLARLKLRAFAEASRERTAINDDWL